MRSFQITDREAGGRLDKYLFRVLDAAPAGFVYKMLRKKNIVLNERKASGAEILTKGDEVRLYLSEETFLKFAPSFAAREADRESSDGLQAAGRTTCLSDAESGADLDIVYEDEDILVINKPAGLLSQKAKPEDDSANDHVIAYLLESGQMTEKDLLTFHPSICNRLDRNTSGLLIAGKTLRGLQGMAELLRGRELKKYYHALVAGRVSSPQSLTGYLTKDEKTNRVRIIDSEERDAMEASEETETEYGNDSGNEGDWIETAYRPLDSFGDATLLEIHLITGKTHQIRAHLASIGHPILGDGKYGDVVRNRALEEAAGIRGQLLCACRLEFPDGRVLAVPDPDSFRIAEEWLARSEENREKR